VFLTVKIMHLNGRYRTRPRGGISWRFRLWIVGPDGNEIELMEYTPDSLQLK